MRVFIVDDSEIVRDHLIDMFSEFKEIEVAGEAGSPQEAIESIQKLRPDAVILDIQMPGGSGIDVLSKIKKDRSAPMVIVLTNYPYPQYRKKCMDCGADFFFDKSTEFGKVIEVIESMAGQSKSITPASQGRFEK